MTLKNWLDKQGFPHGMECVGEARLQQLWDAAQNEEREAIIMTVIPGGSWCDPQEICDSIRERSNVELRGCALLGGRVERRVSRPPFTRRGTTKETP